MKQLIFCDTNKELVKKVQGLFANYKSNKWDVELSTVCDDIFETQAQNEGFKICTASNPEFDMAGGLDSAIKTKFPGEVLDSQEFNWTANLFFTVTVNSERKASQSVVARALIGVFAYAKQNLIFSGFGTGIGGLTQDQFLETLELVLQANIFLTRANLTHANLTHANLRDADLTRANLTHANLTHANLRDADLSSANLSSANLTHADLSSANLRDADLRDADLSQIKNFFNAVDWLKENFETDEKGIIVYKRVDQNGTAQYSIPKHWIVEPGSFLEETPNPLPTVECACGVNFATLKWCTDSYEQCSLWKCRINWIDLVNVVVPYNTDGKARCAKLELLEIVLDGK